MFNGFKTKLSDNKVHSIYITHAVNLLPYCHLFVVIVTPQRHREGRLPKWHRIDPSSVRSFVMLSVN